MGRLLRCIALIAAAVFVLPCTTFAAVIDDTLPDAATLAQLELRAQQAKPREQCFLYTELVHTLTEIAGRETLAGNAEQASAALKKIERYAQLIHMGLANDAKRLMNAQMLMHHTTRRLDEYVHKASAEDREVLQATLKQLTHVEDELLMQVFAH